MAPATSKKQLRNRACLPLEEEGALPDGVLGQAMQGGVVIVPPLQRKFVETFGKPVSLSTIYHMLARHGHCETKTCLIAHSKPLLQRQRLVGNFDKHRRLSCRSNTAWGWHKPHKPFLGSASIGGILVATRPSPRRWGGRWRCRRCTSCCIGTTGANSPLTKGICKAVPWPRKTGKKRPETLAEVRQDWAQGEAAQLMFQDEARFGRINGVHRCWTPKPVRPLCQAMLAHGYTYAFAAVEAKSGEPDSLVLPHANTECIQLFLDGVAQRYPNDNAVMVLDGAGWHNGGSLKPPPNMKLLPLPPYAPEATPSSMCGTNCVKSISITASSIALMALCES